VPRPSFKAHREQRKLVKSLAALGLPQEQIATTIGIRSPKTLRKHFRKEIRQGTAEANAAVARVAFEMATSGKWPVMTRYWMSVVAVPAEPDAASGDEECETEDGDE
jgi:hypothetical protein